MDNNQLTARTEFAAAINQIASERGISPKIILDAIKQALVASFKKDFPALALEVEEDETKVITAEIDEEEGEFKIFQDGKDITPPGFGRIAAQTAKQVILQQIREAEKTSILDEYQEKLGEVINGMVQRMDGRDVIVDIGRGQGVMPPEEQVGNEYYKLNSRVSVLIKEIGETMRGESVIVSRSDPKLVRGLFAREVPEVGAGSVIIKAMAREAGSRTKVAVESTQDGVDPVGSCVGQKGVRVQAVINELNGEKIDIIQYSEDQDKFITAALAPADGLSIKKDKDTDEFVVTVPDDQLSLAIGRGGQNVKLAAKLTGVRLKIISDKTDPGITVTGDEEFEIDQLGLPKKIRNLLVEAKMIKIEDILFNPDKLDEIKGIGPKSLKKIKEQVLAYKPPAREDEKTKE
ncbi:transcription termination factor NusA [Patescibacteria group bacterium]|nr:transcription termination factor NusA [Patescibacteria group bacterium]MBU1256526.1 transcription termination factor NusA [Patescibacteria group bacterium]MBU1457539.1 transcription termination factor NusA [Patescibacteria group bacterium]